MYCNNNPIIFTDPSGMSFRSWWNRNIAEPFRREWEHVFGNGQGGFQLGYNSSGGLFVNPTYNGATFGPSAYYSNGQVTFGNGSGGFHDNTSSVRLDKKIASDVVKAEQEARMKYNSAINTSSWLYSSGEFLNDFSYMRTYFDISSVGFELNQMALLPYLSKIDDFTQFGRLTRSLGGAARATGILGTGAGVVTLGFELKSVQQGDISKCRFGYHATSFGAAVGVGMAYGNLPGAAAGAMFWYGETFYDTFVVPGMNMVWELEMKLRSIHESILYW
jgi:hypothetical protein